VRPTEPFRQEHEELLQHIDHVLHAARVCMAVRRADQDSRVLHELGVPGQLEGIVCVQVFKAVREYGDSATFDVSGTDVDGARLRLGRLPDEYLRLRARLSAQRDAILSGITGHKMRFDARIDEAIERERRDSSSALGQWRCSLDGERRRSAAEPLGTPGTGSIWRPNIVVASNFDRRCTKGWIGWLPRSLWASANSSLTAS
jgi:hypothetical protein